MNLLPITLLVLSKILCADGNIFDHLYRKSEPEPQPEPQPEPEQNMFPESSPEVQMQRYRYAPRAQVCLNSRTFEKYFDGKQRSCQKIRLNADRRNRACRLPEFNNNCPQTCGKCCEVCTLLCYAMHACHFDMNVRISFAVFLCDSRYHLTNLMTVG